MPNQADYESFRSRILRYYHESARSFPWRETRDPYAITVSEIMLQQTQADRVVLKYKHFLEEAPTWKALAELGIADLLTLWQGLGYNRRALALQRTAQALVTDFGGELPNDKKALVNLPGIGPYTAAAIQAFAFNEPVVMIETNIRRVYIHHFFPEREQVSDAELFPLIEVTMNREDPRHWYYALMDYGSWLAKQLPNPNRRSKHYAKQSRFQGSKRQLRGYLVRLLLNPPLPPLDHIGEELGVEPLRVEACLRDLAKEGFPVPRAFIKEGI